MVTQNKRALGVLGGSPENDIYKGIEKQSFSRSPATVNLEIFARDLFSQNFADAKFRENNTLGKWRNHCRILMDVTHALVANFQCHKYDF